MEQPTASFGSLATPVNWTAFCRSPANPEAYARRAEADGWRISFRFYARPFSVPARLFWIRGPDGFGRDEAVAVGHLDFRASQPSAGPGARRKGRPQPRIQSGSLSVHLHRKTQKVRSGCLQADPIYIF